LTFTFKAASVAVAGTPYHLDFKTTTSGDQWEMDMLFTRVAATGNQPVQTHKWFFVVPGADAHVDNDLTPASIHTHSDLGTFGTVDLSFQNPSAETTQKIKCGDGTVIGSTSKRTGTLSGNFDFDANDGYFDQVHRTSFPVTMIKVVRNGKFCTS